MTRLTRTSLLLALCCLAGAIARAQDKPSTPPIKMGLWESTVTSNISGIQLPPDIVAKLQAMGRPVPGGAHTLVSQGCMTPDEWTKVMERMNSGNQSKCTFTNGTITSQKISFDMSCASERGGVFTGNFEINIDDDEHSHGSVHMKTEGGGPNGQPVTVDTTLNSHFISADCGDVKPGDAKIIKNQ